MSLIAIDLDYSIAQYHYRVNKDSPEFLRVHIEPTHANHSWGRDHQAAAFEMIRQDIDNSWQDRLARLRAFTSELIRAHGSGQAEKFRKLALQFHFEFGMSQDEYINDKTNQKENKQ